MAAGTRRPGGPHATPSPSPALSSSLATSLCSLPLSPMASAAAVGAVERKTRGGRPPLPGDGAARLDRGAQDMLGIVPPLSSRDQSLLECLPTLIARPPQLTFPSKGNTRSTDRESRVLIGASDPPRLHPPSFPPPPLTSHSPSLLPISPTAPSSAAKAPLLLRWRPAVHLLSRRDALSPLFSGGPHALL